MTLSGLTPGTVYHFKVRTQDAAGNLSVSSDSTFRSADVPPPPVRTLKKKKKYWLDELLDGLLG